MVPVGFNIFTLLQMPTPAGGSEGWRIVMKNDSIVYEKVSGIFRVSDSTVPHMMGIKWTLGVENIIHSFDESKIWNFNLCILANNFFDFTIGCK